MNNLKLLVGTLCLMFTLAGHAQGTVRYVNNFNQGFGGVDKNYNWDVDGNGSTDFVIIKGSIEFNILPEAGNHVIAIAETLPDLGSLVVPFGAGVEIGSLHYAPAQWTTTDPFNGLGALFNACANGGCFGPFVGVEAYFGFQFLENGETYYGWAFLRNPIAGFEGGLITEYAYNTVPGESIFTAQVPEPSTWALLGGGGAFLWWRCRRREKTQNTSG